MSEPGPQSAPDEALVDLLIKQVTEGLSSDEQRALDAFEGASATTSATANPAALRLDLERAAAALTLAGTVSVDPPPALRERLELQAQNYLSSLPSAPASRRADNVIDLESARRSDAPAPISRGSGGRAGWFAAAACLLLAVFGWLRSPQQAPVAPVAEVTAPVPAVVPPPEVPPPAPPTPAEARAALLAKADTLKVTLGPTKDPAAAGVAGDVVWDAATQSGYLHFVGLAPNDPRRHQYQAWIFDGARDKRYPVDVGVFDVPDNATDVVIPIHAALAVIKPAAFAVTVEKPGGVVVSARAHIVVLGAAS